MAAMQEPTLENEDRPAEMRELLPTQPLPRAVPRDRSKDDRGGYDCEFVEPPPSGLQAECPVCLLVLKEPCLISCCGHKFCRECIERIQKDKKPCAICNEPDFTFMRERALERSLKDLEVWCSYRKEGCEWKGKLGKLEEHLNRDPSPENQLNGCLFVARECSHKCGEWFQRRHITTHETQQCKKRPYSCDYCRDYHSTFEDVTEVHYLQCGKYPVACPNDCDVYKFERQKLESHLREECPLVLVDCPFHFVGCEARPHRKDIPDHTKESTTHLSLLATATQKLCAEKQRVVKENQELRQNMEELNQQLEKENQELRQNMEELNQRLEKENQELRQNMEELNQRLVKENQELQQKMEELNQRLVKENQELQQNMKKVNQRVVKENQELRQKMAGLLYKQHFMEQQLANPPVFPVDYYVKQADEVFSLPSFYTHANGYQMRLCVYPNGVGDGKGTHVSIFAFMMQGPFDDYLKWPFRGEITIQIVNQVGDHDHVEDVICYSDKTPGDSAGRVTNKERGRGWGNSLFLAHDKLQYNAEKETQYLMDDNLHICVMDVTHKLSF